jgi:hypothetical protein
MPLPPRAQKHGARPALWLVKLSSQSPRWSSIELTDEYRR